MEPKQKNPFEEERKRFCREVCNENSHFADACHGNCPLDGDSDGWYLDGDDEYDK